MKCVRDYLLHLVLKQKTDKFAAFPRMLSIKFTLASIDDHVKGTLLCLRKLLVRQNQKDTRILYIITCEVFFYEVCSFIPKWIKHDIYYMINMINVMIFKNY